jgi:hypothetical protein
LHHFFKNVTLLQFKEGIVVVKRGPSLLDNPIEKVKRHVKAGKYKVSEHASKRQNERDISLPKVLYVLTHGYHEEEKSLFDIAFQTWKYAIRGRTIDGIDLRVIVSFSE